MSSIIGVLTEVKDNENRIALTPEGVAQLVQAGHKVLVQRHAGKGSGYHDHQYIDAGAEIQATPEEIASEVDILMKVKEPIESEYHLLGLLKGKTLFTYLHLSGVPKSLTKTLLQYNITAIAYETVEDADGGLPLLVPMSEVAGVLAVQYGAEYLQKKYGGRAKTLGEIQNVKQSEVVIFGAGIVGKASAKTAAGMGSHVTLFDINEESLKRARQELKAYLGSNLIQNVVFAKPDKESASDAIARADVLISGVLVHGAHAPRIVSKEQVHLMKDGAVIVDVSIDQGGSIWGAKPTTHSNPIYELDSKIYCCVTNMPGQVAYQSTQALTGATLPYILKLGEKGTEKALQSDTGFLKGLNTYKGYITYQSVAKDLKMVGKYMDPNKALTK